MAGAVLASVGLAEPTAAQALDPALIVPGRSVGRVYVGMPAAELLRLMGEPDKTSYVAESGASNHWDDLGAFTNRDGVVVKVCAHDRSYATAEGVHVGSGQLSVQGLLPKPLKVYRRSAGPLYGETWEYRGMQVFLDNHPGQGLLTVSSICVTK